MRLDGETAVFFIVGDPIAQVKSPATLTADLAARGVNAVVVPGHVTADGLPAFLRGAEALRNVTGLVFTVPHKQAALTFCTRVTERAEIAGSVNVARRTEAGWIGDNTDGLGFVAAVRARGGVMNGRRALLVGAGGAGAAIAYELLAHGAAELRIHDLDVSRRDSLVGRLDKLFPGRVKVGSDDPTGADIVGNATPLGMQPGDPLPVRAERLTAAQFCADVVTRPAISPFIATARAAGCATSTGTDMFEAQKGLLVDALLALRID